MPVVTAAIGAATAAYNIISGAVKEGKANRIAGELNRTRPKRSISSYAKDDYNLAKSELSNGMSADAERAYDELNNKQLTGSLDAILKSGGSQNNVGEVYGHSNEGRMNFAILKDNARLSRVNNLVKAYQMMNEEDQANFVANEFAPWKDKAEANGQARTAAAGQVNTGLNTLGGAAMGYFENKHTENLYEKYFGNKSQPNTPSFNPRQPVSTFDAISQPLFNNAPQRVGNFGTDSSGWGTPQPINFQQGFTPTNSPSNAWDMNIGELMNINDHPGIFK